VYYRKPKTGTTKRHEKNKNTRKNIRGSPFSNSNDRYSQGFRKNSGAIRLTFANTFVNFLRYPAAGEIYPLKRQNKMKMKLLLVTLLAIFAATMGGCRSCSSTAPGNNSNVNTNQPTPTPVPSPTAAPTPIPSPTATPAPTPDVVVGIPECDDLFAKFTEWAAEKNKNGSRAEKMAVAGLRITLIGPLKTKIDKMKPGDREKLAGQCSLAALQFEKKQRALEIDVNKVK
jgi:hypothetical protein